MSNDKPSQPEDKNQQWLAAAMDGGLPQILAGPAGKAISRLIGAAVEIPAAYLDGVTQGIRDKTDARTAISQAIADHVKQTAVADPAVMERAMNTMLSRAYRVQQNRDSIAKIAVEDLTETPPDPDSAGPSEDWMNKFERYAEDASSVDLQLLFGKILAGEVRTPGIISPATLHFVSMLDSTTAGLIDRVLPYTAPDGVTFLDAMSEKLSVSDTSYIEQSGFFAAGKHFNPFIDEEGRYALDMGNGNALFLVGKRKTKIRLGHVGMLSIAGKGLLHALKPEFNIQAFFDLILTLPNVETITYGKGFATGDEIQIPEPTILKNPNYVKD